MWTAIFIVLSVILCVLCLVGCLSVARNATRESESVRRRLRSCESRLESIEHSLDDWKQTTLDLANQLKMRKVRAATTHSSGERGRTGEPDARVDPEGWRAWQNKQLRTGVVN
jgi:hypothetical protein